MRPVIQQYIQAYAIPAVGFLAVFSVSAILAGLSSFGRMGAIVTGVCGMAIAVFGGLHVQVSIVFFVVCAVMTAIFGYLLFFGIDARRRR